MKPLVVVLGALTLVGCAVSSPPVAGSLEGDRDSCRAEAASALYPSALAMPTPAERSYPWTAGRDWPQNSTEERLRERDIFEACMAQRGHPTER